MTLSPETVSFGSSRKGPYGLERLTSSRTGRCHGPPHRSVVDASSPVEVLAMDRTFMKRRLRQLVREELERTDVKAIVREVVREFLRERLDERDWHGQQRRHELKGMKQ